jgi:hypothetical protein
MAGCVNPNESRISTSYVERFNLSVRMHNRRMTRLSNVHSKTTGHHAAMVALRVAYYNFCRKHETLKKGDPAMAAGLADRFLDLAGIAGNGGDVTCASVKASAFLGKV